MSLFRYYEGVRIPLHSGKLRSCGRLIVIDDSGEIGSSSIFCVLAASVTSNAKKMEKVTKVFPPNNRENKHYNSLDETKVKVLNRVAECDINIFAVSYDKSKLDIRTPKRKKLHNLRQTLELLELVLSNDAGPAYDIIIDNTPLIDGYEDEFVRRCHEIAAENKKWIENIEMRDSGGTKVLQVHDYIASTIGAHIERERHAEDPCHDRFRIIEQRIRKIIKK